MRAADNKIYIYKKHLCDTHKSHSRAISKCRSEGYDMPLQNQFHTWVSNENIMKFVIFFKRFDGVGALLKTNNLLVISNK